MGFGGVGSDGWRLTFNTVKPVCAILRTLERFLHLVTFCNKMDARGNKIVYRVLKAQLPTADNHLGHN